MSENLSPALVGEAQDIARLTSAAYQRAVTWYRTEGTLDAQQADALARSPHRAATNAPSHELSWLALNTLLDSEPSTAAAIWERVKRDAGAHVASGSMVAEALAYDTPWQRAQFLAVRMSFYEEWQPVGGVERALLDTLASAFCTYLHWLGEAQRRGTTDPRPDPRSEGWRLPLQTTADALDQAAQMADRFNRLMIRTLRALRDLRRYSVTINGPAQVNIGQQQVNVGKME